MKRLPKTRSGKILRKTLRQLADGEAFAMPSTIDDPLILDEISAGVSAAGHRLAFENAADCAFIAYLPFDPSLTAPFCTLSPTLV